MAADIYNQNGDFSAAMDYINRAIIAAPDVAEYYLSKGMIYDKQAAATIQRNAYGNAAEYREQARKTFHIAESKAANSGDNSVRARACGALAFGYYYQDPVDRAKGEEYANLAEQLGGDPWGNANKVLDDLEAIRKKEREEARARKEKIYVEAIKLSQSNAEHDLRDAKNKFKLIKDYKDSNRKIEEIDHRLQDISEKKKQEKEKQDKWNKIKFYGAIAVGAFLVLAIIIGYNGGNDYSDDYDDYDESSYDEYDDLSELPEGAVEYNGHYYKLYNESMLWTEAEVACEEMNGHLVTITTAEEQQFVVDLIESYAEYEKYNFWIGGSDADQEGVFTWVTGESIPLDMSTEGGYENWKSGQPNNNDTSAEGDQDYMQICCTDVNDTDRYGKWYDMSDTGLSQSYEGAPYFKDPKYSGYICEWDYINETSYEKSRII